MDRAKLDTMIEKKFREFLKECVEWSVDNVHLGTRKKGIPVEGADLSKVMDLFRDSMNAAFLTRVDRLQKEVSKEVDGYVSSRLGTDPKTEGNATPPGEQSKKPSKKVTKTTKK